MSEAVSIEDSPSPTVQECIEGFAAALASDGRSQAVSIVLNDAAYDRLESDLCRMSRVKLFPETVPAKGAIFMHTHVGLVEIKRAPKVVTGARAKVSVNGQEIKLHDTVSYDHACDHVPDGPEGLPYKPANAWANDMADAILRFVPAPERKVPMADGGWGIHFHEREPGSTLSLSVTNDHGIVATIQETGWPAIYEELENATAAIQYVHDFFDGDAWTELTAEPASDAERAETVGCGFIFLSAGDPDPCEPVILVDEDDFQDLVARVLNPRPPTADLRALFAPFKPLEFLSPVDVPGGYRYAGLEHRQPPGYPHAMPGPIPDLECEDGPWDYPDEDGWDDDEETLPGMPSTGPVESFVSFLRSFISLCDVWLAGQGMAPADQDFVRVTVPMAYYGLVEFKDVIARSLEYRGAMWADVSGEEFIDRWAQFGAFLPPYGLMVVVEALKLIALTHLQRFEKETP